jgi:hypothetical protein
LLSNSDPRFSRKNKFILFITLFSLFGLTSCIDESGDDDNDSGGSGSSVRLPSQFMGEWIRNDLSDSDCEENYDVNGDNSNGASESQGAYMEVTGTGLDADSLKYSWRMYIDDGACDYTSSSDYFDDYMYLNVQSEHTSLQTSESITFKVITGVPYRQVSSATMASALNGYNSSAGACGKTDWGAAGLYASNSFGAGCGVISSPSEDGMDDFKFSNISQGDELHLQLTRVGANLTIGWSTDGGTTFDTDVFIPKP